MPSLSKLKISSRGSAASTPPAATRPAGSSAGTGNASTGDGDDINVDDIDEVDDQGQNVLLEIIKQLRPGSDLARITLPTFILERKSMLERITNQLQEPDIVIKAKHTSDPLERFLLVVKWYMACWHIAPKAVKKPLNPILGELFTCYWDLDDTGSKKAYYVAEQTSHHPPKSSYFYMIPSEHIRVDGIVIPKSKFLGNSTEAQMDGITKVQFLDLGETYTLTQPNMFARGILFGKMKFELGDHMVVKGGDYVAEIEFKVKGFISGGYNQISGVIKKKNEPLYELTGKWNEVMYLKDLSTKKETVFFDTVKDANPKPPKVKPLAEQLPIESRKLWREVLLALAKRDHELATNKKFDIENEQRIQAKKRQQEGVEFVPNFFKEITNAKTPEDEILEFTLYKELNGENDEEEFLEVIPVLPGQKITDEFKIPEFKPTTTTQ